MLEIWFNNDINKALANSRRMVIVDPSSGAKFLLDNLNPEIIVIEAHDQWEEIEARYKAEKYYQDKNVLFYATIPADKLTLLMEYAVTGGTIDFSNLPKYLRHKIFAGTGVNATADDNQLLLASKLCKGKDLNWWKGVATGITNPFDLTSLTVSFLNSPESAIDDMGEFVAGVFRQELYALLDRTYTDQKPAVMAKETIEAIFLGLLTDKITPSLFDIYKKWIGSVDSEDSIANAIEQYAIPDCIDPTKANPYHPFTVLDRKLVRTLSDNLKDDADISGVLHAIVARLASGISPKYRATWLVDIALLFDFKFKNLYAVTDIKSFCELYQKEFVRIDTAIRNIYVGWLNEPSVLRPIQHYYEQLMHELLTKWYEVAESYTPTQRGVLAEVLNAEGRIAVIVGDGLRLEMAEEVARIAGIKDSHRECRLAVLPSVTECGMSALYDTDSYVANIAQRVDALKTAVPGVEIKPLDKLSDSETAQKLVLTYGDIDQVGEKKQLSGLKDISNYPSEIATTIKRLLNLGYDKVYITADHGFVITGLLDDADKIPAPKAPGLKVEERYVLSKEDNSLPGLMQSSYDYPGYPYQYFAKSDKPFVTKGAYGYAHGGLTPQECIIPLYCFTAEKDSLGCKVTIINKHDLVAVTGSYFTIKIKAEDPGSGLFGSSRKIKLQLFDNTGKSISSEIINLSAGDTAQRELSITTSPIKLVVSDADTTQQLDSCKITKSSARDLDDLF